MKTNQKVTQVLDHFHKNDILYCHWKSNEHISAAVLGDTDLDILFDWERRAEIEAYLLSTGFVKGRSPWFKTYPYIEDYLYINSENNNVIHVHAHYKLIIGETNVKSYHLDWEKDILADRIWDDHHHIYTASPEYELLLLIVRVCLKNNWSRRFLLRSILNSTKVEYSNSKREFQWLLAKVDTQLFSNIIRRHFGDSWVVNLLPMLDSGFEYERILEYANDIQRRFKKNRRYNDVQSLFVGQSREFDYFFRKMVNRSDLVHLPVKRTLPQRGYVISLLGADGTGKSTTTSILYKILSKKFDVVFLYMGSGKGKSTLMRKPFDWLKRKFHKRKSKDIFTDSVNKKKHKKHSKIMELGNIIWAVLLYRERRTKLRLINKLRTKGYIIITDRYPQNLNHGYNDGPLLNDYLRHPFFLYRYFAKQEHRVFEKTNFIYPDLLIKLYADIEIIKDRRPEMTEETIERKQANILNLVFNKRTRVCKIPTNQPPQTVVSEILKEIKP